MLGLTEGRQRPYVYPLMTPAGFPVTSECPADHPHHNSLWIGADHLHCRMPVEGGGYSIFGRVTAGLDIVETVAAEGNDSSGTAPAQPISLLSVSVDD